MTLRPRWRRSPGWCSPSARRRSIVSDEMSLADAYAYTAEVMAKNLEAADATEGIEAFLAKREPIWQDR